MHDEEPKAFEFGPGHRVTAEPVRPKRVWLFVLLALLASLVAGGTYIYLAEPELARDLLRGTPLERSAGKTTVYKWKDSEGSWQITDRPPADGIEYQVLEYRSDTNIMPLVPRDED